MPDLDVLMILADYYDVEIREILEGEKREQTMDEETKETMMKVAEYADAQNARLLDRLKWIGIAGLAAWAAGVGMIRLAPASTLPVYDCLEGIFIGITAGALASMVMYTTGLLAKVQSRKTKRRKLVLTAAILVCVLILAASILASLNR